MSRGKAVGDPERESVFNKIADRVSYGMGTPTNIIIWIVAVGAWIAMGPYFAKHSFLPAWFTSNGFNFPLNTVTTIAELYIGFLVGAASNRSERALSKILAHQTQVGDDDLAADQDSRQQLQELRTDFAVLQAQHAEQTAKLSRVLTLLETQGGDTP
jgi:low affinity Fe/Cu permease